MSDRWLEIERLYHEARERNEVQRAAWLADACAGDDDLRQEVETLLASDEAGDEFLEKPVSAIAAGMLRAGPEESLIGRQIGAHRITARLGSGGMGDVYRARDEKLKRDVAIKVLPPVYALDEARVARLEREARMLAALNHPHIAAIYGIEPFDGRSALVLELVEGPTLAEHLARGPLPQPQALRIARQLAEALEAAHGKGIVHRDLTPANIKVTGNGSVKVLDFGIAKTERPTDGSEPTLTAAGVVLGTPAYVSPEQALGRPIDKRTDIWSFGCVLYEMLTGVRAFPGDSISATIAAVVDGDPDWSRLPSSTPLGVRRALRTCLSKDPRERLRDIGDLGLLLDEGTGAADSASLALWRSLTLVLAVLLAIVLWWAQWGRE